MSAATEAYESKRQDGDLVAHKVGGSVTIYNGTMVVEKTDGYAEPGVDGSSYTFLGVAYEGADNSSGSDGDMTVRLWKTGVFEFNIASATQTLVGTQVYITDDKTVASSTTNSVSAGYVVDVISSTKVRVRIDGSAK